MRKVVLQLILFLGRYAILPVVVVAFAIFFAWFVVLDDFPRLALLLAPLALPLAPISAALAVGLLLVPNPRTPGYCVDEQSAPRLWSIWREFDKTSVLLKRELLIGSDLDASIGERRNFFGLMRAQLTLKLGLTLLMVLDERAIRAVIAHEVAHAKFQHTSGGVKLYDFLEASENLFEYADPDNTIIGGIARRLLDFFLRYIWKEYVTLLHKNEFAADSESAKSVGRYEAARALILVYVSAKRIDELITPLYEKELLGAIEAPAPPLERIVNQLDSICSLEMIDGITNELMAIQQDDDASHPSLRARLANLGFSEVPEIDSISASAFDSVLPRETATKLLDDFNNDWRRLANSMVQIN
ncbi:MAG TPA: M48 family metalloprotease [Xanthobacteraceae bacterium]|jgi:hypothetical protein|nr:M48 family metalloprotease [Xanthobacteraceae bacterium]